MTRLQRLLLVGMLVCGPLYVVHGIQERRLWQALTMVAILIFGTGFVLENRER